MMKTKSQICFSSDGCMRETEAYANSMYQQQQPLLEGRSLVTTALPSAELPVFAGAHFQMLPDRQG